MGIAEKWAGTFQLLIQLTISMPCPGLLLATPQTFSSINPLVYRCILFLELVAVRVSVFLYP